MAEKILAIQGNSFKNLNIITDTTYLLALEAQRRSYKIYWYETKDINFINSKLIAEVCHIKFLENKKTYFKIISKKKFELKKSKVIFIRQNPPFNMDYVTSTLFLDTIKDSVKIVNDPTSIRNISEKLFSINFKKLMPPKIFTKNLDEIKKFVKINKKILITIDDAFLSFYNNAWPVLKKNQIPFILFTSTETIGNKGYMTMDLSLIHI